LIGKAVAHECGATFFSISASSITSKWIGACVLPLLRLLLLLLLLLDGCVPLLLLLLLLDGWMDGWMAFANGRRIGATPSTPRPSFPVNGTGESEKLVKALFAVAAVRQPSVIFIDEVSVRSGGSR
jgi:hypothetical protein